MDNVGSKNRSLGQIIEKPCVCSRDHLLCLIIMKLGQNDFLEENSKNLKMGHVGSKTRSLDQILKILCALEATFSIR